MLLQVTSELFNRYKEGNSSENVTCFTPRGHTQSSCMQVKEVLHEASIIVIMLESKRKICSCIPLV